MGTIVDMHVHTTKGASDSNLRPEELAGPEAEASLARLLAQLNVDGRLEEVPLPRLSRPELLQMARSLFQSMTLFFPSGIITSAFGIFSFGSQCIIFSPFPL